MRISRPKFKNLLRISLGLKLCYSYMLEVNHITSFLSLHGKTSQNGKKNSHNIVLVANDIFARGYVCHILP